MLLTSKGAYQLITTKQPAQIAQTAFGNNVDCFGFFAVYLTGGGSVSQLLQGMIDLFLMIVI
jgi:hypothetical protein